VKNKVLISIFLLLLLLGMDVDADGGGADRGARHPETENTQQPGPVNNNSRPDENVIELGDTYKQCSNARAAGLSLSATEISAGNCIHKTATAPMIGKLDWEETQQFCGLSMAAM
jgi:hypothetical protein